MLSNAIKHTPADGEVRVRTSVEKAAGLDAGASGRSLLVEVFNAGEPIPSEDLPRIWETFFTVDKSHNREQASGSGIGLAIVRNILTLHGSRFGAVNIGGAESGRWGGVGGLFYFTLPLAGPEDSSASAV
ncbi:ATP-binding protein [Paenibacillus koleovorans]|uniref:ATP-binding protein n=1 Tax=Paenibacillus koleovorans TaxID=121608 RepID=UPI000FDAA459|nr:ATP-binding protein [Paenibacillus koleovorans]